MRRAADWASYPLQLLTQSASRVLGPIVLNQGDYAPDRYADSDVYNDAPGRLRYAGDIDQREHDVHQYDDGHHSGGDFSLPFLPYPVTVPH